MSRHVKRSGVLVAIYERLPALLLTLPYKNSCTFLSKLKHEPAIRLHENYWRSVSSRRWTR